MVTRIIDADEVIEKIRKLQSTCTFQSLAFECAIQIIEKAAQEVIPFDLRGFKAEEFAVSCKTEEEAAMFLTFLHHAGITWNDGDSLEGDTLRRYYGSEDSICYSYCYNGIGHSSVDYCEHEEILVIPFNLASIRNARQYL